jgi:hypothetical protein
MLLVLLERWRYVPLCARQSLSSLIIGWHEVDVAVRHLDEVAEHLVVSDLERGDSGSCALFGLNFRNSVFAPVAQRSPLVQGSVDSVTDAWLVSDRDWWPINEHAPDFLTEVVAGIPERDVPSECSFALGQCCRLCSLQRGLNQWQACHRIPKGSQLSRRSAAGGSLSTETFDVTNAVQSFAHCFTNKRVSQSCYGTQTCFDRCAFDERGEQPLAEQTCSHWRKCAIQNPE